MDPRGEESIRRWMLRNVDRFIDTCGEINCTQMVETWDNEKCTGGDTLDPDHPAWDIAVDVAIAKEGP